MEIHLLSAKENPTTGGQRNPVTKPVVTHGLKASNEQYYPSIDTSFGFLWVKWFAYFWLPNMGIFQE